MERFRTAQESAHSGFESALRELRSGRKRSHWIWYIFPQLAGLGASSSSIRYGLQGAEEAIEYLRDPVLSARLVSATEAVLEQLGQGVPIDRLMGSPVDVLKLMSSLTLFHQVATRLAESGGPEKYRSLARVAEAVLSAGEAQGYSRCAFTLGHLHE